MVVMLVDCKDNDDFDNNWEAGKREELQRKNNELFWT